MIVPMRKITFLGLNPEKQDFLKRLQDVGLAHLIIPSEAQEPTDLWREIQKVAETRKFLARYAVKPAGPQALSPYADVCLRREELGQREARLQTELNTLKKERSALEIWGDFDPADVALLKDKGLDIRFFRVSRKVFESLPLEPAPMVHVARRTEGEVDFVAISSKPWESGLQEEKLPSRSLSAVNRDIRSCETRLSQIREDYAALSEHLPTLTQAEAQLKDDFEYQRAVLNTASDLDDRLFVLQCWSPESEDALVRRIGPGFHLAHYAVDPEPGDRVPVLMTNPGLFQSGEDLVKVYSYPDYKDFDPSGFVLYCFAVFFGMIIGETVYGLILLAATGFLHFKIKNRSVGLKRFLRMSYVLSASVIFFGVISASYIGLPVPPDSILKRLTLLDFSSPEGQRQVMLVTIIIGMVHISLSLGIKFYRTREWAALGWILVIWSGYALIQSKMIKGVENPTAMWIMVSGLLIVLAFTSSSKNPLIRIAAGLNGVLGIIQLFSDVLSYLRLFALGLATAYMTQTFNTLAGMAVKSIPYVGIVMAVLILVGGHSINLLLGIMGGVIHGLRLNFLEWYRWCFEGDGLPYKPFKRISRTIE